MPDAPFLPMAPPLYPRREIYRAGDRPEAEGDLLAWVNGNTFHRYAVAVWERPEWDREEAATAELAITGALVDGYLRWSYRFVRRSNDSEERGFGSGYASASDCARSALEGIEENEREAFEAGLVVGIA